MSRHTGRAADVPLFRLEHTPSIWDNDVCCLSRIVAERTKRPPSPVHNPSGHGASVPASLAAEDKQLTDAPATVVSRVTAFVAAPFKAVAALFSGEPPAAPLESALSHAATRRLQEEQRQLMADRQRLTAASPARAAGFTW